MNRLVAIAIKPGDAFVDALRHAWDQGDAVLPLDPNAPLPLRKQLVAAMAPALLVEPDATHKLAKAQPVEPGDALVMATSGTTGEPKGVVLTHDAIVASATATSTRLGVDPANDQWLSCLPLSHIGGLSVVTRAMATGTALQLVERFDPVLVERAARDGANLVSMVPTMLARTDATLWRLVLLGGAAMPADRPTNTVASYGMTETCSGMVYDHRSLDGVELRVVDDELLVRGPILLRCYRNGEVPLDADGWFATGDSGSIDESGRIDVFGRKDDMIISGGENVWPGPVEKVLAKHAGVREVAVVGRPDPEWGQRVTAVVVPTTTADLDLAELRDLVKAELPLACAPHSIEYVDTLTRSGSGKVRRDAL